MRGPEPSLLPPEEVDSAQGERIELGGRPAFDARDQVTAHPGIPEVLDMRGDLAGRVLLGAVLELGSDLVGQPNRRRQLVVGHSTSTVLATGTRRVSSMACEAPWTSETCTAVTLYSGQLVAQSECSVVTTFAPVTGKWNVV